MAQDGSGDFASIAAAIDAAAAGDTLAIQPGSYQEEQHDEGHELPIQASDKALFLIGLGADAAQVVLTVRLQLLDCDGFVFENLSLSNAANPLSIQGGSVSIQSCIINDNQSGTTGSIDCVYATMIIEGSSFENNVVEGPYGRGGAIWASSSSVTVTACTFSGNQASQAGGAIYGLDNTTIADCLFLRNGAPHGAAIAIGLNANVTGCTFWGNETASGGTLFIPVSLETAVVQNSIIAGTVGGRALECEDYGVFTCCAFWANEGGIGGGFWDCGLEDYLEADPLFCDPATGDLGLREGSPCLPGGYDSCGLIGARGLGCGVDGVLETSWGMVKSLFR